MEIAPSGKPPSLRLLIVHADDLGLTEGVSRGIERAHREGILTSASLLANAPGFDGGVRVARDNPALGVGVHLNLVRGRPVAPASEVTALAGPDGRFDPARLRRPGAEVLAQAEREYRAQLAKVRAAGVVPTHLDAERHHFHRPPLYALAAKLAREEGLAIRTLREPVVWALRRLGWPGRRRAVRSALLRVRAEGLRRVLRDGPPHPDWFAGQTRIGGMTEAVWLRLLAAPPPGAVEVMTHPGGYDPAEMATLAQTWGPSWIDPCRPAELAALTAPAVRAAAERWPRGTFADLPRQFPPE